MIVNIPVQFKGQARLFRQRVAAAEREYNDVMVAKVMEPLRQRLIKKPTIRRETVADVQRIVASLNSQYRISSTVEAVKRGHLRITQHMIGLAQDREDGWDQWDRSIGIIRIVVTTEGGDVKVATDPVATISSHAIARYYERTGSPDDVRLLADIATILDAEHEEVVIASKGVWIGKVINAHYGERRMILRSVRTYLDFDSVDYERRPFAALAAAALAACPS